MTLLEQIKNSGIVGCGGAGFPTHIKLNCNVEYLIINAAECEPLLRTDRWLMIHKSAEIIKAVEMIADIVQAKKVYIALKETYQEEISCLSRAIEASSGIVSLYKMHNFYPAGDEQIMVCDVTGRTVPPSGIPLDVGTVVSNIATTYAIWEASQDIPFTHKYLTMTGAVNAPCIVHAPLGASFEECLKLAGGASISNYKIVAGGPMMGKIFTKDEAAGLSVTKTTSGFLILPDDTPFLQKKQTPLSVTLKLAKSSCIQCSCCTQMCPRYLSGHPLQPHLIMRKLAYAANPEDILDDDGVKQAMICSECGLCETYACPMGLQPRQVNIYVKGLLRQKGFRCEKPQKTFTRLEEREYRRVPSKRVAMRLGVDAYYSCHIDDLKELTPSVVNISLQQHIGAPSIPVICEGDKVTAGQLIASIPEKALGANIHASINGTAIKVSDSEIVISAEGSELR